jgi:hypothetical protein
MRRCKVPSALVVLLAIAGLHPRDAAALQASGGKLIGRVVSTDGTPIAQARILVPGTAFGAETDPHGNYFINNLPAARYTVEAAFLGFQPVQVTGVRILDGQTLTVDFQLTPRVVELQEISVIAAPDPLAPRDAVTTRQRLDGEFVSALPVDRIAQALSLLPGVTPGSQRGTRTLTIRGGRPDEAAVYVDGVPVNPGYRGTDWSRSDPSFRPHGIDVGVEALQEATVTTGAASAEYGYGQSGVVSYSTRSGGRRHSASLAVETDEVFGVRHAPGFNKVAVGIGGPVRGRLGYFVSGELEGRESPDDGPGALGAPIFVSAGRDTTVAVPSGADPTADTTDVNVYRFAVYRGRCEDFRNSSDPGIARNYGYACQGIRYPAAATSTYHLLGKLDYTYGTGSRIALSMVANRNQGRRFTYQNVQLSDYENLYNPQNLHGFRDWSRIYTLSLNQSLSRRPDRAVALDVVLSRQLDGSVQGPLSPSGEADSRDPFGGFLIRPVGLRFDFESFPITDGLIRRYRAGHTDGISPLDPAHTDDYAVLDRYRNNAYGLLGFAESGGPTGLLRMNRENRWVGRVGLDWQADRFHRVRTGAEGTLYDITEYENDMLSSFGLNGVIEAYHEHPLTAAVYGEDRIDLGDVVIVGGLRLDHYESNARRPRRFGPDEVIDAAAFHARTTPRVADRPHTALSPRIQVAFPVSDRTAFRLSYAHQVQAPDFGLVFGGVNGDPALPSIGSDLDFSRTISFEFGARHNFSQDLVLDLSAYYRSQQASISGRTASYFDGGKRAVGQFAVMANADYGFVRGLEVRLDMRRGDWWNGFLGYSYTQAENTGSDPFSYYAFTSNVLATLAGQIAQPPLRPINTINSRPHSLTGSFAFTVPQGWERGRMLGDIASGVGVFGTFQFASGTPYTRCRNDPSSIGVLSGDFACSDKGNTTADFLGARLPMLKTFDVRVTKAFAVGVLSATAYLDVRNLFDFLNVARVFTRTGTLSDRADRDRHWAGDSSGYASEARAAGHLLSNGSMDLRFAGIPDPRAGCGDWVTQDGLPNPANCVYLIRAEERWGDGDHLFTTAEQRRASMAYYIAGFNGGFGSHRLTLPPRRLRIGFEIGF